jgi:hypothetical protein
VKIGKLKDMQIKMQQDNSSFLSVIITICFWVFMKISTYIGYISIANFASFCVVISAMWAMIANSGKAIENIERFYEWYKQFKKK